MAQYRVLRRLGQGGMGVVFEAEDTQLRRRVALKILKPSLAQDPSAQQRFLREARAAAGLHHDHVVTIYQVGEADGPAGRVSFLAMELLEGVSLQTALAQRSLSLAETVRIGREVAEGLAAAHAAGLIHRDVKPDNIWLEGDGRRVKLLDFGLARAVGTDAHLTAHGVIVGTPAYMAPEQAADRKLDGRADMFSLGCVLYRLCTGRLAFPTTDLMATLTALATREPDPVRRLNPTVPPALAKLIHRLLEKVPADRPASAAAVAAALRDIGEGQASPSRRGRGRRRALLIGLAALTLLAGVIFLRPWDRWESGGGTTGNGNEIQDSESPWAMGPGDGSGYTAAAREDFEDLSSGQFPADWLRLNHAWVKGNGVEVGEAAEGQRCLRLFGSLTQKFSAEAAIALPPRFPVTLRFRMRQGDEPIRGGVTHHLRGMVGIGPPGQNVSVCVVYADGLISVGQGRVPLPAHRWREFVFRCDRVGAEDVITSWVDGTVTGQYWRPAARGHEAATVRLTASCGSLWFDDVRVLYDSDTPADREVMAAWLAALRQTREQPGPALGQSLRAFAAKNRNAPAQRHRELAQFADVQAPAGVPLLPTTAARAGHTAQVTRLAWASDGRALASTAADGTARLWCLPSGNVCRNLS